MSTKAAPKRPRLTPPTPVEFGVLAGLIAGAVADKLAKLPALPPPSNPSPNLGQTAPQPATACSVELIKLNHERAGALCTRLFEFEKNLRGENSDQKAVGDAPRLMGLNSALEDTAELLAAAHSAMTRIGSYIGIEV